MFSLSNVIFNYSEISMCFFHEGCSFPVFSSFLIHWISNSISFSGRSIFSYYYILCFHYFLVFKRAEFRFLATILSIRNFLDHAQLFSYLVNLRFDVLPFKMLYLTISRIPKTSAVRISVSILIF
jgi:hypothetical protein